MKRMIGIVIGVVWFGLAFIALRRANNGWATGYEDIGFWWTVIAVILSIAAVGGMVGTWIHTRPKED